MIYHSVIFQIRYNYYTNRGQTVNCNLYQINTRVWLRRFDTGNRHAMLDDVPMSYWKNLADKGIDYVWLMGIWKICESTIEKYCLQEGPTKDSFRHALSDYQDADVIGSPYSIDRYDVNPMVGTNESLILTREMLHSLGMKLILDFVPNHFSADSSLVKDHPEIFLEAPRHFCKKDPITFYQPLENEPRVFAHGRDPFFPAWEDTIQINYFSYEARSFMLRMLRKIAKFCDGVRCDVAMLMLNASFRHTWQAVIAEMGYKEPDEEFWKIAIRAVKAEYPEFIFIAEAYWDKEWELQQSGFDFTYDKRLTDRLKAGNARSIRDHLRADDDFQNKSLRFLENHDEERAVTAFGKAKSKAAAIIISTLQGMRLYYDGQFEGKQIRLPVQLRREPPEPIDLEISEFYEKLLHITHRDMFGQGQWQLLETLPAYQGDESYHHILAWIWTYRYEKIWVAVNYADSISTCRIRMDMSGYGDQIRLNDMLNDESYLRSSEEIRDTGLYIELRNYFSHIFAIADS